MHILASNDPQHVSARQRITDLISDSSEYILAELTENARALQNECYDKVTERELHGVRPVFLVCRFNNRSWGPRIVWVRSFAKGGGASKNRQALTKEIPIHNAFKYSKRTFAALPSDLQAELLEIEGRASELRKEVAAWRAQVKFATEFRAGGHEL